jgi:uncharacterized protein
MNTKTALITGASGGIGYELAKRFANEHYHLVLVARSQEKLIQIKRELEMTGISVEIIAKDLGDPSSPLEIYNELQTKNIHISVLVNNAGFGLYGLFHQLDLQKQAEMINLNVTALTQMTWLFVQDMIKNQSGHILNIASTAAFQPGPLMAVYFATKAHVLSFSEALHEELNPYGITVTALCPGATKTDFGRAANAEGTRLFKGNLMSSDKVAKIGFEALFQGNSTKVVGSMNYFGTLAARILPRRLMVKITKKIME